MEYRKFGPTDMTTSVLGFGCWEMGGGYGDVVEDQTIAAVNRAMDLGINCFDTAPAYGRESRSAYWERRWGLAGRM